MNWAAVVAVVPLLAACHGSLHVRQQTEITVERWDETELRTELDAVKLRVDRLEGK